MQTRTQPIHGVKTAPTRRAWVLGSTPRGSGFTLLEVLIATVAFAIVLGAINGIFYSALRLRNRTVQAVEQALPLHRAMAVIKRDLANLVLPGAVLAGPLQTTQITNSIAGQVSPEFFTASGIIDETSPWAEIQKVTYALMPSSDRSAAGLDLVRAVTRNLLPPEVIPPPETEWLMSGVQSLVFYYYDGLQWRGYWDSTVEDPTTGQTNLPPKAIKVQIYRAPSANDRSATKAAPLELVVPIFVEAPPLAATQGAQ